MYINRFFILSIIMTLAGCSSSIDNNWTSSYTEKTPGTPSLLYDSNRAVKSGGNIAVLLPLSGTHSDTGHAIRTSVEIAALQHSDSDLKISFYDTSDKTIDAIGDALKTNPDIIIGPVFASDARQVRTRLSGTTPVLSFTSDISAVGDGVMTMALMPTNSIESIIREMAQDDIKQFIIIAPETESGKFMAGVAQTAGNIYDIVSSGVFYYTEGDSESIKTTSYTASMNESRTSANTEARRILSDILATQSLTPLEKSSLTLQLEKLSKTETLGDVPYQAVLFLGNGEDTATIASFLRYYGLSANDARFYGTALWQGSDITRDFTMVGAKYASLPDSSLSFSQIYEQVAGVAPNRMASFGYDATNLSLGMLNSFDLSKADYLLNSSGYIGTDGLFRIMPTGVNQRSLNIVQLNGTDSPRIIRVAPSDFQTNPYLLSQNRIYPAPARALNAPQIRAQDYILIPARFRSKSKNSVSDSAGDFTVSETITILPTDQDESITDSEFLPIKHETIDRQYIDSVEIVD